MRNIIHVIESIYGIILKYKYDIQNSEKESIIVDMDKLIEKMLYSAPERLNSSYYFHELETIMNHYICQDDYISTSWCKQVIDIFLNPNYTKNNT
jgi:hypothetical protein